MRVSARVGWGMVKFLCEWNKAKCVGNESDTCEWAKTGGVGVECLRDGDLLVRIFAGIVSPMIVMRSVQFGGVGEVLVVNGAADWRS